MSRLAYRSAYPSPPAALRFGALLLVLCGLLRVAHAAPVDENAPSPNRYEVSALPLLLADTDRGFMFGAYGLMVRFRKGSAPYLWRLQVVSRVSVERGQDDTLQLPFHDHRVQLDLPGVFDPRLRLDFTLAFRRYTDTGYYGIGNASPGGAASTIQRYTEYERTYPGVAAQARWRFTDHIALLLGATFTYNWIDVFGGSKLAQDLAAGDDKLSDFLRGTDNHPLTLLTMGWLYDSRDHEFTPTRGMFHELSWRFSPLPDLVYGGLNATGRFFYPLLGEHLVLAARVTLDMLFGNVPIYELARLGGLVPQDGIGGARGIRGVPLQRYHGKIKLFGNFEARSKLLPFTLLSQRFNLGVLAFVDLGRTWSDYHALSRFDGDGVGLKVGFGGGLRLQWGETFILRGDLAWSPDADPVGAYIAFHHIF